MVEVIIDLHLEKLPAGGYRVTSTDVPELVVEGQTMVEATKVAQGSARKIIESCILHGLPLPGVLVGSNRRRLELVIPVSLP